MREISKCVLCVGQVSDNEGDESDESEFWGSSSSDSESESEDERPEGGRLTAEYFLKK